MLYSTAFVRPARVGALLLAALTVALTVLSAIMILPVGAEGNIASDQPVSRKAFDESKVAAHTARAFTEGAPVGMRLHFGAPFTGFTVCMPTWSDTTTTMTMSLYKWNTDFDTTRKSAPVATKHFDKLMDNGHNGLTFDELPAGEYLICIDDFAGGRLGVWQMDPVVGKGYTYEGTMEKEADWEINVSFAKTPVEAFLPVESVTNTLYGDHTAPAEPVLPADALVNTHKVMPDTWVFTDGLGRESLTYADVGGPKDDKTVAMFYWTWHVDLAGDQPLNLTDFTREHPESVNDYDYAAWPKGNTAYFWNEPIWGYYRTNDPWVLRRQAELLANAGVDTILTDNTNGNYTWRSSYTPLYETWSQALETGAVNVPKISYLLPFASTAGSVEQIENIYLDIYRSGKYQNLWFYWDEKPMLMAHPDSFSAQGASGLHKEIRNYFTFRPGYAGYINQNSAKQFGSWGWLSVTPQATYYANRQDWRGQLAEQTTVGVAMNHSYATHSIAAMNGENVMGRSYSTAFEDRYTKEGDNASLQGYNFAEQWETALEINPKVVFVTGWNEWTAGRHETWADTENAFPDQFNDEYSRDIEPTKGALKDHYYYLLVNCVRKFKGCNPIPTPSEAQTIDLAAGNDQWTTAEPYYAAYIGNTADRDAKGYGTLTYTETSGRNDIIGARVARDADTVWFYVECNENITPYTDALWMNLLIDCDQKNQGWETFDFAVNKSPASADTLVLERFTGDGYTSERVADVKYRVNGQTMVVEIPKSALGLTGNDYTVNFAWTDNVHDEGDYTKFSGDIMDFYISGDVAPGGRFKFSYVVADEPDAPETDTAESDTLASTADVPTTDAPTVPAETDAPASENGCASALGAAAVLASLAFAGGAVLLRKRED